MRIAIADDHAFVRGCLTKICREVADVIEIVESDSYDGLASALTGVPAVDLVILDLCMPPLPPLEGIDLIRRHTAAPIAVISGTEDRATIRAVLARGVAGYIPKRLGTQAIASALRLVLAGETFVPSLLLEEDKIPPDLSAPLTEREREVLKLLRDGLSNKAIARQLDLCEATVKSHMSSIFRKLGVNTRLHAAQLAGQ